MGMKNSPNTPEREALRTPLVPGQPLPIAVVRAMAKQARSNRFYRKLYALELFMSGEFAELAKMALEQRAFYDRDEDLGLFPAIDPEIGDTGVQNHGLINSRINIQAVAFSNPEFILKTDEPLLREVLSAYLEQVWEEEDLSGKAYETGMDVECMGIGFWEWGMEDGGVTAEPFSPLDCLWDRARKSPQTWRYFFIRRRMDLHEAFAEFGHLVDFETLEHLAVDMRTVTRDGDTDDPGGNETYPVVCRWNFWHKDTHCVFLGTINGGEEKSVVLRLNANMEYEVAKDAGPNPFGVIPVSKWIDSWSPGVMRPVGKTETTTRMAGLLNRIEAAVTYCIDRGLPLTILTTIGLTAATVDKLANGVRVRDLEDVILCETDDAAKAVHRVAGLPIPQDFLAMRAVCKEELNAATGVVDAKRGVIQQGERSAFEARSIQSESGTQSGHTRKQFQKFLREGFKILFAMGRLWESKRRILMLTDGPIDTKHFPLRPLLALPIYPDVREDSLQFVTNDERKQRRLIEFQTVDLAAIDAGVGDPMKIFTQLYRDLGHKDVFTRLKTPDEYQQALLAQVMASRQGVTEHGTDQRGGGSPSDGASR